jgi:hypothetical protein
MTGIPHYNAGPFLATELVLLARGHEVVNPWRLGEVHGWGRYQYMRRDITELATCDAIYMLPGWWRSWGAKREFVVARLVFGMRRYR